MSTVSCDATPRAVSGMPASAGIAVSVESPGTTSYSTPAAASASTSSAPRPKMNGSPPLSRTTLAAAPPWWTRSSLTSSWVRSSRAIRVASTASLDELERDEPVVDEDLARAHELERRAR